MSNEVTDISNTDNLAAFSAEFFGTGTPAPEDGGEAEEVVEDVGLEDSPEDDTLATETDEPTEDEGDTEAEEAPVEPEKKPKKDRFQERIDQLNEKARKEKERADALEARLAKLEAGGSSEAPKPVVETAKKEPSPDDVDDKGEPIYPLGEFDPKFTADFIKHRLDVERQERLEEERQEKAAREAQAREAEALAEWNEKLIPAQERYPDFQERGEDLLEAFEGLDERYGEFLVSTIMAMDAGPDVLYYLSTNLDEAHRIVGLGAAKAAVALGRIEAKFDNSSEAVEETKPTRVSKAPPPPPANKGSTVSKPTVAADTDDFASFKEMFFKSR